MTTAEQSQTANMFEYLRRQANYEAAQEYAERLSEMEQRFLRRDYPNLKDRIQAHVDKGEPIPTDLQADYVNASILTGNLADIIQGFKPKKKDKKGFSIDPNVEKFILDEAEKIVKTSLAPALALDVAGVLGNYGTIDSLLTPVVMAGGMAGYLGGRHHVVDGPVSALAGYTIAKGFSLAFDYFKDGRINEAQPGLVNYMLAYALAATAGKTVQYVKDNLETKTKPALYAIGRGIKNVVGKADKSIRSTVRNMVPSVGFLFKRKPATGSAGQSSLAP